MSQGRRRLQGTVPVELKAQEKKWDQVKSLSVTSQRLLFYSRVERISRQQFRVKVTIERNN